jgi:uncharacterized repeat protein (TIGR01451 family)
LGEAAGRSRPSKGVSTMKWRVLALILGLASILILTSATLASSPDLEAQRVHAASQAQGSATSARSRSVVAPRTGDLRHQSAEGTDAQPSGVLADVSLHKSVHSMVSVPGGWVNYVIDYENHTDAMAQIIVTDTMPHGVAYQEAYWGGGSPGEGEPFPEPVIIDDQLVWELGETEGGSARWFHLVVEISSTLSSGHVLENCATIGIIGSDDSRPEDNTSCDLLTVWSAGPNLMMHKEHEWSASEEALEYRLHFMNAGTETISDVRITDTLPLLTTSSGDSEANLTFPSDRLIFSGTVGSGALGWQFSNLEPGDAGWLRFDANLDEPGVPQRWFTNTVEIDVPPDDTSPDDNFDEDVAFSGYEVREVHMWVDTEHSNIWGLAQPGALITVTTPYTVTNAWADPACGGCWETGDSGQVLPGDWIEVVAGAGVQPVSINVPEPFTADADSGGDQVWGQIDHLDSEWIEVELYDGPIISGQTDGDGNYSVFFSDFPRGGAGEVRYDTQVDFAQVIFHRSFLAPDLVLRVNYGHDWVSARYKPGHTAWITVTESDNWTVKAVAEVTTGPVPWWEGQSGFETQADNWMPQQPDIMPGDWVHGVVDNGYTTTVQLGEITIGVDVNTDIVSGTISAPWPEDQLLGICAVWEEFGPQVEFETDLGGGSYWCDLDDLGWDLTPWDHVAVQYKEPDDDWVINVLPAVGDHVSFVPLVLRGFH